MRTVSANLAAMLTGSREVYSSLAVHYGGEPVLDAVAIESGSLDEDASNDVPASVRVSIPRYVYEDEAVIDVFGPGSPINAEGTRIGISYTVGLPGAGREVLDLGWFRITEWSEGDGLLELTATGLQSVIQEARLLQPVQTAPGSSYAAVATALVENLLPLRIVAQNATSDARTYDEDRLAALRDLIGTWPARAYIDPAGVLTIAQPYDDATDPVALTLTDGEGGTVVKAPRSGTRDGVYNAVKVTGEASGEDVAPVSAVAYLTTGPRRWNGPYGNVPYFYSSPLITTPEEAQAAALTRLANLQVIANPVTIETAPDPRIETGDLIELRERGSSRLLRVDAYSLPLTYAGTMSIRGHEVTR